MDREGYMTIELAGDGEIVSASADFLKMLSIKKFELKSIRVSLQNPSKNVDLPQKATIATPAGDKLACLLWQLNGSSYVVIFDSLSELLALQSENARLKEANQSLTKFAMLIAHDFKEPFRTIRNFIQLLKSSLPAPVSQESDLYMSMVSKGADRMADLINGVLQYYKTRELNYQKISASKLISEVLDDLGAQINESNAIIDLHQVYDIYGDRPQVYLLFKNIISNAIKFRIQEKSPLISIDSELHKNQVKYTIRDNGIGIDSEYHGEVFEFLKRLNPKGSYEGSGIGLAFCKSIVLAHGGQIWVESDQGQGAAFTFLLPKENTLITED